MVSAAAASGREVLNPRSWRSRAGAIVLAALSAAAVSACGSRAGAPSPLARVQGATIHPSLATSIETSAGSWVTVPMGHLDQPLNTFWQLFFRPRGGRQWSNTASALAVATNGGLVLATDAGKSLTIGIRPTNYLAYSPLIVTSNARSWSSATPLGALAEQPDALAVTAGGAALALVAGARTDEVSASSAGLAGWRTLVTAAELSDSRPGRVCGVGSITAVGFLGTQELVGASCARRGVVGVFSAPRGSWRRDSLQLVGPRLSSSLGHSGSRVLGLQATSTELCALVSLVREDGAELVAACTRGGTRNWRVSPALPVPNGDDVISFGPTDGSGLFALTSGPAHRPTLAVLRVADMGWDTLASPPPGTDTVVFGPAGSVDAFVANDTLCTDWSLGVATKRWTRAQQIQVAIQFGSSS